MFHFRDSFYKTYYNYDLFCIFVCCVLQPLQYRFIQKRFWFYDA